MRARVCVGRREGGLGRAGGGEPVMYSMLCTAEVMLTTMRPCPEHGNGGSSHLLVLQSHALSRGGRPEVIWTERGF